MRRIMRILLILAGFCLVLLLGTYLYLFQFGGLESIVNDQVRRLLGDSAKLDVTVGRLRGGFLSDLIVEDISVVYFDSAAPYEALSIPRLSVGYDWHSLWQRNYHLEYLYIDSAHAIIVRDSSGLQLSSMPSTGSGQSSGSPNFAVDRIGIHNASLIYVNLGDTLTVDDLELSLALQAQDQTFAVDIESIRLLASDDRLGEIIASGKATYSGERLAFTNFVLVSGATRLRLDGMTQLDDSPSGQVSYAIDNLDLARLAAFIGPKLKGVVDLSGQVGLNEGALDGSAHIAGDFMIASFDNLFVDFRVKQGVLSLDTLYGTILGGGSIDGRGAVDFSVRPEQYHLDCDIRNFNLIELVAKAFRSDLNGRIHLQGESFRTKALKLQVDAELYESTFDEYPIQNASGTMLVTTDSIWFADSFTVSYYENLFRVGGVVEYSDSLLLRVNAELNNLDRYRGKLFLDEPGGRGWATATLSGRTSDPDLRGRFWSDSLWLYGLFADTLVAEVDIDRFLAGRQGSVVFDAGAGMAWDIPFDTLSGQLRIDSNLVFIDSAWFSNEISSAMAHGTLDYAVDPMRINLDSLELSLYGRKFYNRDSLAVGIDSAGFLFDYASIGDEEAMLAVNGQVSFDETMGLQMAVRQFPIAPWLGLFDTTLDVDGAISLNSVVGGSFREPTIRLAGEIDSLTYQGLVLGNVELGFRYADRRLELDSVVVRSDPGLYRATGYLAADLALASGPIDRFPDSTMDIHVTAQDSRFDLVSVVLPSVEQLDGDFSADVRLSGTPDDPTLQGGAHIMNARLKYFDLAQPIYADSIRAYMTNNRVMIEQMDAYVIDKSKGDRRRFAHMAGDVTFLALDTLEYNIVVDVPEQMPFTYELDDISGRFRGQMYITGSSPPVVSGRLTLQEMKYLVNFAEAGEGSPIMAAIAAEASWDLDLDMNFPSKFWIQNDDISAEFSGDIGLERRAGVYQFTGELELLRGRGFLFDKTLRLDPGGTVMFDGEEGLNPRLQMIGRTRVAGISQAAYETETTSRTDIDVCLQVSGTVDLPEINPCSESNLSREEMLQLLVANYYSTDSVSASTRFEERIAGVIGSQVSQIGTKRLSRLGVETFEIDPYYGDEFDPWRTRVTLGFYTAPNLYVYGRSALSLESGQEVGFEYRFPGRNILLEGRSEEENRYRFSLKLHWEF